MDKFNIVFPGFTIKKTTKIGKLTFNPLIKNKTAIPYAYLHNENAEEKSGIIKELKMTWAVLSFFEYRKDFDYTPIKPIFWEGDGKDITAKEGERPIIDDYHNFSTAKFTELATIVIWYCMYLCEENYDSRLNNLYIAFFTLYKASNLDVRESGYPLIRELIAFIDKTRLAKEQEYPDDFDTEVQEIEIHELFSLERLFMVLLSKKFDF